MDDEEKKSEPSTFAQRAAAARAKETTERELRIAQVVEAVLSKHSDGVNTRTTATFRGAGGRPFDTIQREKVSKQKRRKPKSLDNQKG